MPNLRPQKENRVAFDACVNKTPRQLFRLIWRNNSQIVPKNGLFICTSSLQVFHLQVEFTSAFLSVLISVFCLTVVLTVIFRQ